MTNFLFSVGSLLVVGIVTYFIPMGISKMGKVVIVLAGFIFALGGLAATTFFSFVQILGILLVLIITGTYILNRFLGKYLFQDNDSADEQENIDEVDSLDYSSAKEIAFDYEKLEPRELEILPKTFNGKQEPLEEEVSELIDDKQISGNKEEIEFIGASQTEEILVVTDELSETSDEEISFLLNRKIESEVQTEYEEHQQGFSQNSYLTEIEELLKGYADDREITGSKREADVEIPVMTFAKESLQKKDETDSSEDQIIIGIEEISPITFEDDKEGKKHE
jgi:hypothetical protein